ncbi:MAG: 4Fe-4S binding protein [Desulfobacterales bacterium]|nr:4Fe-4S binding protein [Desulfobacterales bacterium]
MAAGAAPVDKCAPGGKSVVEVLAGIMGVTASSRGAWWPCSAAREPRTRPPSRATTWAYPTCRAAKLSAGGTKTCSWGCMGYGDCTAVCKFDALAMGDDGLPHVDYENCTGCGMCVAECPQELFALVPGTARARSSSAQNRAVVKPSVAKACKVGCIKCEICVKNCPEKCITMENGIPVTDYSKCTSCGICVTKCPTKCYKMLEDGVIRFAPVKAEAAG